MNIESAQKLIAGIWTYIGRYAPHDGVSPEFYQPLLDELQAARMRYSQYRFDGNLLGNNEESEAQAAINLLIEALATVQSRLFLPLSMLQSIAKSKVLGPQYLDTNIEHDAIVDEESHTAMLQMIADDRLQIGVDFKEILHHLLQEIEVVYEDTETAHDIRAYFNNEVG